MHTDAWKRSENSSTLKMVKTSFKQSMCKAARSYQQAPPLFLMKKKRKYTDTDNFFLE